MHINGIMITNQCISNGNFKRLRGSVGRVHILIGNIFLNSNEEIVVRDPKSKIYVFILYSFLSCMILQFIFFFHLSKSLSFILSLHGFRGARTTFSNSFDARYRFV